MRTEVALLTVLALPLVAASDVTAGLDLRRPADRALARFADTHPQCQLWTNWRKMCSRTGPNGATSCLDDPDTNAAPSEPFCAAESDAVGRRNMIETAAQWKSEGRFCADPGRRTAAFDPKADYSCGDYTVGRPFNGLRIGARAHPWCGAWREKSSLKIIDVKSGHRSANGREPGYYCDIEQVPRWCDRVRGFGTVAYNGPWPKGSTKPKPEIRVGTYTDYDLSRPVTGIYCGSTSIGKYNQGRSY